MVSSVISVAKREDQPYVPAIGGVVFCSVGFVVTGLIIDAFFDGVSPNYLYLAISGLLVGVISQSGDLIMSVIKRHYGIKDYGKIIPGHGGIMDRFDSILLIAPIYVILYSFAG